MGLRLHPARHSPYAAHIATDRSPNTNELRG